MSESPSGSLKDLDEVIKQFKVIIKKQKSIIKYICRIIASFAIFLMVLRFVDQGLEERQIRITKKTIENTIEKDIRIIRYEMESSREVMESHFRIYSNIMQKDTNFMKCCTEHKKRRRDHDHH